MPTVQSPSTIDMVTWQWTFLSTGYNHRWAGASFAGASFAWASFAGASCAVLFKEGYALGMPLVNTPAEQIRVSQHAIFSSLLKINVGISRAVHSSRQKNWHIFISLPPMQVVAPSPSFCVALLIPFQAFEANIYILDIRLNSDRGIGHPLNVLNA